MQNRGQNLRIPELLIKLSKSSVNSEAAISVLNSRQNERNLVTKFEPKSSEYAFCSPFAAISKSLSDRFSGHLGNGIER